jgi:hypothetical protein
MIPDLENGFGGGLVDLKNNFDRLGVSTIQSNL